MRKLTLTITSIALVVFAGSKAAAELPPPPLGMYLAWPKAPLCDTKEQLQTIVDAFKINEKAGYEKLVEWQLTPNDKFEPTCAITKLNGVGIESVEVGTFTLSNVEKHNWMVHIKNSAGEGWYLWTVQEVDAVKQTNINYMILERSFDLGELFGL